MKAILVNEFGAPEVMKLTEIQDPKPARGEILVKLQAIGINPVDTYIRAGQYAMKPELPYTPGKDGAGIVEAIGGSVSSAAVGDRVYIDGAVTGAYAEKALCLESQIHRLPENISFEQGAGIGVPYSTAYHALFHRAKAVAGETVLIHGASGGVGTAAVQLARAAGLTVIATGGTDEGRKHIMEQGAHYAVDHKDPKHAEQILGITGGQGVDVIIEMLANVNLGNDLPMLAKNGRVVVIGSRGKVEIDPRDLMGRNAAIFGMVIMMATDDEKKRINAALYSGFENGTLRPVIGKKLPLAEAARGHHEVMESPAHGKIILVP
jgi:NADPH2:quinone reductase